MIDDGNPFDVRAPKFWHKVVSERNSSVLLDWNVNKVGQFKSTNLLLLLLFSCAILYCKK